LGFRDLVFPNAALRAGSGEGSEKDPEKVPEKVLEKVPEKVWEALVQRLGSTGFRRRSARLWCRARTGFAAV
jgi:hypothetical protein